MSNSFPTKVPGWAFAGVVVLAILVVIWRGWFGDSQYANLQEINGWIKSHENEWKLLVEKFSELNDVEVFGFTGGNGMLGLRVPKDLNIHAKVALYEFALNSGHRVHIVESSPEKVAEMVTTSGKNSLAIWHNNRHVLVPIVVNKSNYEDLSDEQKEALNSLFINRSGEVEWDHDLEIKIP